MLYEEVGGLGWPHPYEYAAATLFTQSRRNTVGDWDPSEDSTPSINGTSGIQTGVQRRRPNELKTGPPGRETRTGLPDRGMVHSEDKE